MQIIKMIRPLCFFGLLGILLVCLGQSAPAFAQSGNEAPAYWTFDTPSPITHVTPFDSELDGYSEFAVVYENTQLVLLKGDGSLFSAEWESPLDLLESVRAITPLRSQPAIPTVNESNNSPESLQNILILHNQQLRLIGTNRLTIWRQALPDDEALDIQIIDVNGDGLDEFIVRFSSGDLSLYGNDGEEIWTYSPTARDKQGESADIIQITDLDRDNVPEILYGYSVGSGFSRITRLNSSNADETWHISISGYLTALSPIAFNSKTNLTIAVGTEEGGLHLFSAESQALWQPRTLNTPISQFAVTNWFDTRENGMVRTLVVGTDSGKLIAYNEIGRRIWDKAICRDENALLIIADVRCSESPAGAIKQLTSRPLDSGSNETVQLAVLFESEVGDEILLLSDNHEPLGQYRSSIIGRQPLLIDSNSDKRSELLRVNFATLALLNPGTSARSSLEAWNAPFQLGGVPTDILVTDFNNDSTDELLVGAAQRVYYLQVDGNVRWVEELEGTVSHLSLLEPPQIDGEQQLPPHIVVGYNTTEGAIGGEPRIRGSINLLQTDSDRVWNVPITFESQLVSVYLDQTDPLTPILIAATENGSLFAYQLSLVADEEQSEIIRELDQTWQYERLWERRDLRKPATYIATLKLNDTPVIVTSADDGIRRLNRLDGTTQIHKPIPAAETTSIQFCQSADDILYLLDGSALSFQRCFDRTIADWQSEFGVSSNTINRQTDSFTYRPVSESSWLRTEVGTRIENISDVELGQYEQTGELFLLENTPLYFAGDLTGDGRNDFGLARQELDEIWLDLNEGDYTIINLDNQLVEMTTMRAGPNQPSGVVVLTENGFVNLYRILPNYPPLLTNPRVENEGQYIISVDVLDVEQDSNVGVTLLIQDSNSAEWIPLGEKTNDFSWVVEPRDDQPITYKFEYHDGNDHNNLELFPPVGPAAVTPVPLATYVGFALGLFVLSFGGGLLYLRQRALPSSQAQRFYRELKREEWLTLDKLRERYNETGGSAEWLLALANEARGELDNTIASLSDGLYLLANQPGAGLPIINDVLRTQSETPDPVWHNLSEWRAMFGTTHALLTVPTLTELGLMRSELENMLAINSKTGGDMGPFPRLLPIFDSLRDSDRVESADDRLIYLSDAAALIRHLQSDLNNQQVGLSSVLVNAITARWTALISTESESLRGRARIDVRLKTNNIASSETASVAIELRNSGRARAEQVVVTLEEGEAELIEKPWQLIPSLSPGHVREVRFPIVVPQSDRFRVSFNIRYSDRQAASKSFDYANVVHVLTAPRDFKPIINPYSPGTPLRRNSNLFFGRNDLFHFIADSAQRLSQKNVLILVGQRRTGKTSALLRLEQHLPENLLAVYIDCQSLGVLPGMTALFQDIAWLIADALAARGIDIDVPDLDQLQTNPGHWFERVFVPHVREVVSAETQILLVFDEFEAFQNLVEDGILPKTFFPFLRHLMQHSEGLSFVFVGTHRLEEMSTDYWSVLFNIALYKEIGYLTPEAAKDLIMKPTTGAIVYDDLALDKIWRLTAGHPYFLQLVCYSLVKRANTTKTGYITISDVNATVDEMLGLGEVHFAYIWQQANYAERAVLIAVAHLIDKEQPFTPRDLIQALTPYGVTLSAQEVTTALNELVERNIIRENNEGVITIYELHIGLIGMWIENTKSLSKLHSKSAERNLPQPLERY